MQGRRLEPHVAAIVYFVIATAFLVWPLFPLLGNRVEPRIFALPFALAYVLGFVVLDFLVLLACYRLRVVRAEEEEGE